MALTTFIAGQAGGVLETTIKKKGKPLDISGATSLQVRIYRPDGTSVTQTAAFVTTGVDGMIDYTLVATDTSPSGTDVTGRYRFRFRVVDSSNGLDAFLDDHHFQVEALR